MGNRFDQKAEAGQCLMRKCKALLSENRELGDELRDERMAELSAACQVERRLNAELLKKVGEAGEFCKELSSENDKLQGTVAKIAGKLREARAELEILRKERAEAKARRKKEREIRKATGGILGAVVAGADSAPVLDQVPSAVSSSSPPVPVASVVTQPSVFETMGEPVPLVVDMPAGAEKERKKRKDEDGHRKEKKEKKRKREAAAQADD